MNWHLALDLKVYPDDIWMPPGYYAIDHNTYDGAPDSSTRNEIGHGATPWDAIRDLITILEEKEL